MKSFIFILSAFIGLTLQAKESKSMSDKASGRTPAYTYEEAQTAKENGEKYGFEIGKRLCEANKKGSREYPPHQMVVLATACPLPISKQIYEYTVKEEVDSAKLEDLIRVSTDLSAGCNQGLRKGLSSCQ